MEFFIFVLFLITILLIGFFSAFPGIGSGLLILSLGCKSLLTSFHPHADLLIILCFIFGALLRFTINQQERQFDTFSKLLILFGSSVGFTIIFGINPIDSFNNYVYLLLLLCISYIFTSYSRIKKQNEWILFFLLMTSIINMLIIFTQFQWKLIFLNFLLEGFIPTLRSFLINDLNLSSITGGFNDNIITGLFLSLTIPLWVNKLNSKLNQYTLINYQPWILISVIAFSILSIALLASKIIITVSFVILIISVFTQENIFNRLSNLQRRLIPLSLISIIFFLIFCYLYFGDHYHAGIVNRLQKHFFSFYVFAQNPLHGVGLGQFENYLQWKEILFTHQDVNGNSSVFLLLAESGLIGTLPFIILLIYVFDSIFKECHFFPLQDITYRLVVLILILSPILYTIHQHPIFWCLLGYIAGRNNILFETEQHKLQPSVEYKIN